MTVPDGMRAIVLAAGASRRMGRDKALLEWGGNFRLISIILLRYSNPHIAERVVVANPNNAEVIRQTVCKELSPWTAVSGGRVRADFKLVINPDATTPMIESIKLGVAARPAGEGPLCIQPVDAFSITPPLLEFLHECWRMEPECIHQPACGERATHPVVIPERYAQEILELPPEGRLDVFLREHADCVRKHEWLDRRLLWKLNTPEEYERYRPVDDE